MARVLLDKLARNGSVALEGYGDQVGGQFLLMKFGDAVCKPLVRNEDQFYRCMSNQLKLFAAAYYGMECTNAHCLINYNLKPECS